MNINFNEAEKKILNFFQAGDSFSYNGTTHTVLHAGKPISPKGEPKTDIYIRTLDVSQTPREFKISYKKANADFLENKINLTRASQILGPDWEKIISEATSSKTLEFHSRSLIFKKSKHRTSKGSITLGWKFEFLNKLSGKLSGILPITQSQLHDVYTGANLDPSKKNSMVNGFVVPDSGVANFILVEKTPVSSRQEAVNLFQPINQFLIQQPTIYWACKALNYRTFENKFDGNRPLAVGVEWQVQDGKLKHYLNFDDPLRMRGKDKADQLIKALRSIGAKTTDDLNPANTSLETLSCLFG